MSESVDDPAGIAQWLKTTGYPLEMRVGSAFRRNTNFFCEHSVTYVDPVSGDIRTTDISIGQGIRPTAVEKGLEFELFVNFYIECKARPAPWIVFVDKLNNRPAKVEDFAPGLTFWCTPCTISEKALPKYLEFVNKDGDIRGLSSILNPCVIPGYEICEKRKETRSSVDPAYAAVRQAASAAVGLTHERGSQDDSDPCVAFPVLVTGGMLYEAWMDEQDELQVKRVETSRVLVSLDRIHGPTLVHVVTERGLEDFIQECNETAALLVGRRL